MKFDNAIRGVSLSSLLTLSMSIAHLLGGGELQIKPTAIFVFLFTSLLLSFISPGKISGSNLGLFLLFFQVLGHFSFTQSHNDLRMGVSHIIAFMISYKVIVYFEELVHRIVIYFKSLVPKFHSIKLNFKYIFTLTQKTSAVRLFDFLPHCLDRAPPIFAAV